MSGMFRVGVITSTHGVKGAFKVYPTTDDPRRFLDLTKVFFSAKDTEEDATRKMIPEKVQFSKNQVILKVEGVNDMDQAQLLKGGSLWILDEDAVPLGEDEFYIRDFLDAKAIDEEGNTVGVIEDIMETAANFVFEIREDKKKTFLLPVTKETVLSMDKDKKEVVIHILKGLRE